jgi:WD40 repeat protein
MPIAFEKTLINDRSGVGVGALKWSPDSRRIAFVKWSLGTVGIVDVETGKVIDVPNAHLKGLRAFAWSIDSSLLALSSGSELKVVRLSDSKIVSEASLVTDKYSWRFSFGAEMTFSPDSRRVIFQVPSAGYWPPGTPASSRVILASYDLATKSVEPLLRSPLEERGGGVLVGSDQLQWHKQHLYFTAAISRSDEIVARSRLIGNTDYGRSSIPRTCFVFDLGDGSGVLNTRSMDFPAPGRDNPDGSSNIANCRYSTSTDHFVALSNKPLKIGDEATPDEARAASVKSQGGTFQALELATGAARPKFPNGELPEQGIVSADYVLHPLLPWLISISQPVGWDGEMLWLWDFAEAKSLARIKLDQSFFVPAFAPDGSRIAFKVSNAIAIYRLNTH